VLAHLVRQYDIDGLHLDRVRYPELTATGQTPTTGASIGYNAVSLARYFRRHRLPPDSAPPAPADVRWADWRRDQVTNLVRRIYLTVTSLKPHVTVSAALIAFGGAPTSDASWSSAEAFWRVYQDWRTWLEEGILDVAIPMVYRRDHDMVQARQFDDWMTWTSTRSYDRCVAVGIGAFVNGVEGTVRQARRSRDQGCGVAFFSLATASQEVPMNPWSRPPGQSTPARPFEELASALITGHSVDGRTQYEDPTLRPVFAEEALIPALSWKVAPRHGHLMGFAVTEDGPILDTAPVEILNARTGATRATETDGGGFFGAVDLSPGTYIVTVFSQSVRLRGIAVVAPGRVAVVRVSGSR